MAPAWLRDTAKDDEGRMPGERLEHAAAEGTEVWDPPVGDFPEIAWRGLFGEYREFMQGTTEAAEVAHFQTLWAAGGAALGRRVSQYAGDIVYANGYHNYFGPTGDKKTTSQRRITSYGLLSACSDIKIINDVGSTEGLCDALADVTSGTFLFFWEEFSNLLSRARWSGSTLFPFLTQTYDCPPEWGLPYRKKPVLLTMPTPTVLTATTPEWFWKYATAEDFFGGFGNRILHMTGKRKQLLPNPREPNPIEMEKVRRKLSALQNIEPYRVQWTPSASKRWEEFYLAFESEPRLTLVAAAVKRIHAYVRKLAMLYAAFEGTLPLITAEQLEAAIAVGMYATRCVDYLISLQGTQLNSQGLFEQRIVQWVSAHNGEKVRVMRQRLCRQAGDSEKLTRVLRSLIQTDVIDIREKRIYLAA
jgi:hypothetical protein